jgi:fucose 4-O-acetylase-like acetyltransferase
MSTGIQPMSLDFSRLASASTLEAQPARVKKAPGPVIHQPIRILQAIAILMVVYAHSVVPGHHYSGVLDIPDRFVRTCAVPLFICVSGFLYRFTDQGSRSYGRLFNEKVQRILLPYIFLSTVAFMIKALLGAVASRPIPLTWSAYIHEMLYPWDNAIIFFWFLPTLFLIFCVSVPIDKWIVRRHPQSVLLLIALLAIVSAFVGNRDALYPSRILNVFGACNYLIFFWTGYAIRQYEDAIVRCLATRWRALAILAAAFIMTVSAPDANYGFAALQALCGIAGLFAITTVTAKTRSPQWLCQIGDRSYQIYLLSWFFQTMPIILFSRFISQDEYICAAASFLLGTSGPLCVAHLVQKWTPAFGPVVGLRGSRKNDGGLAGMAGIFRRSERVSQLFEPSRSGGQ